MEHSAASWTEGRKLYVVYFLMHLIPNCSVSYVQVMGRLLSPTFGVEILEPSGKFVLEIKNNTLVEFQPQPSIPSADQLQGRLRDLQHLVYIGNILQGNVAVDMDEFELGEEEEENLL